MFDETVRALRALGGGVNLTVTVLVDEDGYLDRRCPDAECGFAFKVLGDDWKAKVPNDAAYCPFCRHEAEPSDFNTPEQTAYFVEVAEAEIVRGIQQGLKADAAKFNRRPQSGIITMRLDVDATPVATPMSPEAEEAMTLRIACEECDCHFAVIGAAYFCPACGHNSAGRTFDQSLTTARTAIASLPLIKAALPDRDAQAQVAKSLIEGTFVSLVTAFQRFAEAEYPKLPNAAAATPRRNAFQNLDEGSKLWHGAGGREYASILDTIERADLKRLFQQRHLLAHREGIIDQDYLNHANDATYAVGQRLVVREQSVSQLADLLDKLAAGLRADVP